MDDSVTAVGTSAWQLASVAWVVTPDGGVGKVMVAPPGPTGTSLRYRSLRCTVTCRHEPATSVCVGEEGSTSESPVDGPGPTCSRRGLLPVVMPPALPVTV